MSDIDAEEILRFQLKRNVTSLFKQFLIVLEDLADEHDIALEKLINNLPEQYKNYVNLADYLTEDKSELLRKKILTIGNDCYRSIEEQLANYEISIKKKE